MRGESIPRSWGVDGMGAESHDPNTVIWEGGLLPVGGREQSGMATQHILQLYLNQNIKINCRLKRKNCFLLHRRLQGLWALYDGRYTVWSSWWWSFWS